MNPKYSYAEEKFSAARDILAEGGGSRRERLRDAYLSQGHRVTLGLKRGTGDELVERILDFHDRMTATPAVGDEGSITATIDRMSEDEVEAAVKELVEIAGLLDLAHWAD